MLNARSIVLRQRSGLRERNREGRSLRGAPVDFITNARVALYSDMRCSRNSILVYAACPKKVAHAACVTPRSGGRISTKRNVVARLAIQVTAAVSRPLVH